MLRRFGRSQVTVAPIMAGMALQLGSLQAALLTIPNASFELPATGYASPLVESWQKSPKPDWYVDDGIFLWSQLIGAFRNQAPNDPTHIDNCDGNQALWLFVVPEVALFQDYDSVDWNDTAPTHAFDARFEPGKAYQFTVGVIGGGGGMLEGVTLELSLYYRDNASNRVTVAATAITNTASLFPTNTHLVDFRVNVPQVTASDAWAGRNIGVQIMSTVTTNLQGGYWDLDHVRLEAIQGPILVASAVTNDQFTLTWQSEPGLRFAILAATDITQSSTNWVSLEVVTNTTGTATFTDTITGFNRRFYRARQLP